MNATRELSRILQPALSVPISRRVERVIVACLFALALALRLVAPDVSPPGFHDDELSNALVLSQHVRDGDIRLYYPDASGQEGLYHLLAAPLLPLFGPGHLGFRGLSILCGALSVVLLYWLAAPLWGRSVALLAALGLALSFWSLVYSRSGHRQISLTTVALAAFYCLWRGFDPRFSSLTSRNVETGRQEVRRAALPQPESRRALVWFAAAGAAVGVGFYTYFAARGVSLILIAFAGYLLLAHREMFAQRWRGFALALAVIALFAAPLVAILSQNPGAETRVGELAAPLYALRDGDPSMLIEYTLKTLGMFAFSGDDEALYNIPYRPVFGVVGAAFFLVGLAVAVWRWRQPAYAFLLLWMAAGLAPGAMAVPAASLGHTILAQPATMIFPAIGTVWMGQQAARAKLPGSSVAAWAMLALAAIYVGVEGARNLYDYFVVRPRDGFVRVLHHTDFIQLARYLNAHPEITDIAIGAQIEERWNQVVFDIALERDDVRARWHDPREAMVYMPAGGHWALPHYFFDLSASVLYRDVVAQTDDFLIARQVEAGPGVEREETPFALGLTHVYTYLNSRGYTLGTRWRVGAPLDLPLRQLYAKPPAPGEPDRPRLEMFVHVLPPDSDAPVYATGGFGVDPYTLQVGDLIQLSSLSIPADTLAPGVYRVGVGLFDPWTGARYLTADGREMVIVGELEASG